VETDDDSDVLAALLCDPFLTADECQREAIAAARSGVRTGRVVWDDPNCDPDIAGE